MADIKKKLVDGAGLQAAMGIMADYADKGVRGAIGGYNQSFPLTAATKGNIYYHKGTNRYYICVDNYNGSSLTNPNSKFEELSVYTNRQRLDNLSEYTLLKSISLNSYGKSTIDILSNGIETWMRIRLFSDSGIIPIRANTKLASLSDLNLGEVENQTHTIFSYEVNSATRSDISISHLGIYVLNNTQIIGTSQWGFFRIL